MEQTLNVEIERILPGGVGLAHAEGLTIFVPLAAPGDSLRVVIDRTRGKVAFASITEIIKPSPVRIEPPCPYFGRCGGCDFQQLNYETQLTTKVEMIRDCLHRLGGLDPAPDIRIHASPREWHYRARANWQVDSITRRLGYFERGSNVICDVEYCAVLLPELQQALERERKKLRGAPPSMKNIEAVAGDEGVSITTDAGDSSPTTVSRRIAGETYEFSAAGFFQVNHDLLEPIIAEAIGNGGTGERGKRGTEARGNEGTEDATGGNVAVDLYCGVGLFTLPLARRFKSVIGIESNRTATNFARANLTNAELTNATVVTARVGDWLKQNSGSLAPVDFLLLDPPRTGAETKDIQGILALQPRQISYVSCDPATLARDLKKLIAGGYALDSVVAFDMFPQTHHVETVVRLTRA